jgi:hypothetical protein
MPLVGYKPTIPVFEQAKTFHALDHAATVIGYSSHLHFNNLYCQLKEQIKSILLQDTFLLNVIKSSSRE